MEKLPEALDSDPNNHSPHFNLEALCELLDDRRQEILETPVRREASEKSPRAFWPRRSSESHEEESQQDIAAKRAKLARAHKILKKTIVEQEKESTSGSKRKQTELAGNSRLKSTKLEPAQSSEQPTVQQDRPAQPHEAEAYMPREQAPETVFPLHSADLLSPSYGAMQKGLRDMLAKQTLPMLLVSERASSLPILRRWCSAAGPGYPLSITMQACGAVFYLNPLLELTRNLSVTDIFARHFEGAHRNLRV